jgi:poly(hydroxyalkanoate) depolymerase family esterase
MNNDKQRRLAEATRLTRAGRPAEATALIQRALASGQPASFPTAASLGEHRLASAGPVAGRLMGERLRRAGGVRPAERVASSLRGLAGRVVNGSHSTAEGQRQYMVYVPSGYSGAPLPVVVMLHGGTQGAEDFAAGTRMSSLAEQATFLVVYPEQTTDANPLKYWNWFQAAHQRREQGEPSLIAGITRDVLRQYAGDVDQVYVAGFSAGGAMAAVMAATYPDLYAAAGVHSGLAYRSAHDVPSAFAAMKQGPSRDVSLPGEAIPLIVFHGDRDQTVDGVNAERLVEQWRAAHPHGAAGRGAPVVRRSHQPGRSYTQLVYPDARGDAAVEQWVLHGGGHAWSGGGPEGSYTDSRGPDASTEMTRFFEQHRR